MRRPPGLWILLSAGVVWLSLQDVYGIRATSLIFGKSSTTTTTTTAAPEQAAASEEETVTTELNADGNATKPTLTGNPQLDYIWDPNLPKELNGYNLSDYPFYERVPEEIDFKCDGLHDGFYASVVHKCQVYHHCLARTRYDFLCANYTAFDQRTFICHFASEIDCANSKKFWHRNDALYIAASTTTVKPFVIHTPPPQPAPITTAPQPVASSLLNPSGPGARRPAGGRRPFRRRPQFDYYDDDYYDDYYEERPRSNRGRKRPRPRPRPVYYDEYDGDYEDDRYERRGGARRNEKRRPYQRRTSGKRRNQDRGKQEYDEDSDGFEDEGFKPLGRRKPNERKPYDDEPDEETYPENRKQNKRRPTDERDENEKKSRIGQRRPASDDYDEDTLQRDDSRSYNRPRKNEERRTRPKEEPKTIIKPVSGTIYDRPRVAPRIKLPVPKNEADKYAYKPAGPPQVVTEDDEEYYDYEDSLPRGKTTRSEQGSRTTKTKDDSRKEISTKTRQRPRRPDSSYESSTRPRYKETRPRSKPVSVEYYDEYEEYEDVKDEKRPVNSDERGSKSSTTTRATTTTTTEKPIEKVKQPLVRLVKRPFLPSRGGNPYTARGLQPVGSKAFEGKTPNDDQVREILEESPSVIRDETTLGQQPKANVNVDSDEIKPIFKPSPVMINVPVRKLVPISSDSFRSNSYNTEEPTGPKVTQKSKLPERNPLDINEEEYDVTLNDALNPTLPNVPVRDSPVGFIPNNDYVALGNLQRSRYVLEPAGSQSGSDYTYQSKPLVARDRPVYHHCLSGTRYDFLCANYTAFDQTLFNCNFASNVDCENSKKFWHRNDQLYIEKSTTTAAPIAYNIYTPPPQASPLTPVPLPSAHPQRLPPIEPPNPRRQTAPRARPHARPRPQLDYYEEEYEELPRLRNRKKRPRPRPVYYEDYEEYEDERASRRSPVRRRPYWRDRNLRRGKDRRKYEYDDDEYRYEYDDDILGGKSQKDKRRKLVDEDDDDFEDDRRDRYERRRSSNRRSDKPYKKADKRIFDDDVDYEEETRHPRRKPKDETRDFDRRRPSSDVFEESKKIPRLGVRRPPSEDFEDDLQRADNSRFIERSRKGNRESGSSSSYIKPPDDGRPIIKPVSGTIYDRPRVAPRINLPVPKHAADKYAYKAIGAKSTLAPPLLDDDEEDEEPPPRNSKPEKENNSSNSEGIQHSNRKFKDVEYRESPLKSNFKPRFEPSKNHFPTSTTKKTTTTPANKKTKGLTPVDYEDYYDDDVDEEKAPRSGEIILKSPPTSSTTTTESVVEQSMPIIRKFKRPFLPSRGGSPFSARNLQPVGIKASSKDETLGVATKEESNEDASSSSDLTNTDSKEIQEVKPDLKPIPVRVKSPVLPKSTTATPEEVTSSKTIDDNKNAEIELDIKPGPIRIKVPIRVVPPVTEQEKPQTQNGHGYPLLEADTIEKKQLTQTDILNGNYDVTLNEAISPIIPKLPARGFSGFGPTNDYAYKRIQRPTKYVILDPVLSDPVVSPYYVK